MQTRTETEAEREVIRFLAGQPSAQSIIAFHPSESAAERLYDLIETQRERPLTEDEHREMETYLYLEHFLRMLKIEARRQLEQPAS